MIGWYSLEVKLEEVTKMSYLFEMFNSM